MSWKIHQWSQLDCSLVHPWLHFESHQEKTSLSNAEKEKILLRELFMARAGWDSTVLYRQERLILMSGAVWRLLLPRLLPGCCTSPSSCSHRKLWNRLLGSNLDLCCGVVALTHSGGGIRLVCDSCWSIKYARAQNIGVKLVPLRQEASSARKQGKKMLLTWSLDGYVSQNLMGVDVFTQSVTISLSPLKSLRFHYTEGSNGTVLRIDRSASCMFLLMNSLVPLENLKLIHLL